MRGPKCFDIDQLAADVHQAYLEYDFEQLEKMWQHKSNVMGAVLTTAPKVGGSNYPRHARPQQGAQFLNSFMLNLCMCA